MKIVFLNQFWLWDDLTAYISRHFPNRKQLKLEKLGLSDKTLTIVVDNKEVGFLTIGIDGVKLVLGWNGAYFLDKKTKKLVESWKHSII